MLPSARLLCLFSSGLCSTSRRGASIAHRSTLRCRARVLPALSASVICQDPSYIRPNRLALPSPWTCSSQWRITPRPRDLPSLYPHSNLAGDLPVPVVMTALSIAIVKAPMLKQEGLLPSTARLGIKHSVLPSLMICRLHFGLLKSSPAIELSCLPPAIVFKRRLRHRAPASAAHNRRSPASRFGRLSSSTTSRTAFTTRMFRFTAYQI